MSGTPTPWPVILHARTLRVHPLLWLLRVNSQAVGGNPKIQGEKPSEETAQGQVRRLTYPG